MTHERPIHPPAKIIVTFQRRDDGGLRIYSDDVPGLVLSHRDCAAVLADLRPALEEILSAMVGVRMVAQPLPTLGEVMKELEFDEISLLSDLGTEDLRRDYLACAV